MMTPKGARRAVARLSLMKFFPSSDEDAKAALMEDLGRVCQSDQEAEWLAQRAVDLCQQWQGTQVLWQIYFSKFPPKNEWQKQLDRQCGVTEAFPNGIPSETGRQEFEAAQLPAGREMRQLPAPAGERAMALLAEETRKLAAETPKPVLSSTPLYRPEVTPKPPQVITAEQVEEARRLEMERRKREDPYELLGQAARK